MLIYKFRVHNRGVAAALAVLAALVLAVSASGAVNRPAKVVSWEPAKLVGGSPVLFQVSAPATVSAVKASWMGHELIFFRSHDKPRWYALAGIPVETAAGPYELKVTEVIGKSESQITAKVRIARANYLKIPLHVAKQFTEPTPEQLKQIGADKTLKQQILSTESPERLWSGKFEAPVLSATSDVFGTERVFNGEVKSRHLGLDYATPAGTEVRAINRGVVLLAQPLYFEGGFLVIDHGQGVLSLYLHLSEFKVKEGETVEAGQAIALSGASGRATGPHLHLAVRWQGVYVNPAVLLALPLP